MSGGLQWHAVGCKDCKIALSNDKTACSLSCKIEQIGINALKLLMDANGSMLEITLVLCATPYGPLFVAQKLSRNVSRSEGWRPVKFHL